MVVGTPSGSYTIFAKNNQRSNSEELRSLSKLMTVSVLLHDSPRHSVSIVGSLRDREVACSASDYQGSNFESCVWRTVSSQSSHHPHEVLLAQFSLYVHKGGLKPDSFYFYLDTRHMPSHISVNSYDLNIVWFRMDFLLPICTCSE